MVVSRLRDIVVDYFHGYQLGLADLAGQLGEGYAIVMIRASTDDHPRRRVLFADPRSV
jgi:hypothetical protein